MQFAKYRAPGGRIVDVVIARAAQVLPGWFAEAHLVVRQDTDLIVMTPEQASALGIEAEEVADV